MAGPEQYGAAQNVRRSKAAKGERTDVDLYCVCVSVSCVAIVCVVMIHKYGKRW